MQTADFIVQNHGSLCLVEAENALAEETLASMVDDAALWFGSALVVEPRYIMELINGLEEEGFTVGTA